MSHSAGMRALTRALHWCSTKHFSIYVRCLNNDVANRFLVSSSYSRAVLIVKEISRSHTTADHNTQNYPFNIRRKRFRKEKEREPCSWNALK